MPKLSGEQVELAAQAEEAEERVLCGPALGLQSWWLDQRIWKASTGGLQCQVQGLGF